MKFNKFTIRSYKGISAKIEIDFRKSSLIPIIGINESGKTTILRAIQAFDSFNDEDNNKEHLEDTGNLYSTLDNDVIIEADVHLDFDDFDDVFISVKDELDNRLKNVQTPEDKLKASEMLRKLADYKEKMEPFFTENGAESVWECSIGRNLSTKEYFFVNTPLLDDINLNHLVIGEFIRYLPYILYFDDFRDRIDDKLEIVDKDGSPWLPIINRLFVQTNENYSLYELPSKAEGTRRSIISEVEEKLNEELVKEWAHFSLLRSEPLTLKINYLAVSNKHYIEFLIIEKVVVNGKARDRFFKLKDRSKGFYWYFNFIMKLVFNPKVRNPDDNDTIYLLDEPGSYLHATAQVRLTERLKELSKRNKVIYCTHSPYLLNPKIISINHVKVAEKDKNGQIELKSIFETKSKLSKQNSAFQPILDALEIKPYLLNYDLDNIVLLEGIYDYLSFDMFKGQEELNFFPCVNAESIIHHISYMLFMKKKFVAIWDNDVEGRSQYQKAQVHFDMLGQKHLMLLPNLDNRKKIIIQDLFDGNEVMEYKKKNDLNKSISFEKFVMHLYYNEKKTVMLPEIFVNTKEHFRGIINDILKKIK